MEMRVGGGGSTRPCYYYKSPPEHACEPPNENHDCMGTEYAESQQEPIEGWAGDYRRGGSFVGARLS
jgi:hypothetical protein